MQQPLELSMCFTSIFRARAEARSFHALEMPQLLSRGHSPGRPECTLLRKPPALVRVFK